MGYCSDHIFQWFTSYWQVNIAVCEIILEFFKGQLTYKNNQKVFAHCHGRFHFAPYKQEHFGEQVGASSYSRRNKQIKKEKSPQEYTKTLQLNTHKLNNTLYYSISSMALWRHCWATWDSSHTVQYQSQWEGENKKEGKREKKGVERDKRAVLTWKVSNRRTL